MDTKILEFKDEISKQSIEELIATSEDLDITLPISTKGDVCKSLRISDGAEFVTKRFKDRMFGEYFDVVGIKYKNKNIKWK